MEFEKLFAVQMRWYGIGEITEYTVVKETAKTYIVARSDEVEKSRCATNIVKKSDMEIYDKHFCKSYAEALEYRIFMLEKRIEGNERNIAEMTAKNATYRAIIDKTNAELQKLYEGVK